MLHIVALPLVAVTRDCSTPLTRVLNTTRNIAHQGIPQPSPLRTAEAVLGSRIDSVHLIPA